VDSELIQIKSFIIIIIRDRVNYNFTLNSCCVITNAISELFHFILVAEVYNL